MKNGYHHRPGEGGQQLMKKQLLLLGVVFLSSVWLLFQWDLESIRQPRNFLLSEERLRGGFLVNTIGCKIQDLDPFDSTIRKYLTVEKPPACNFFEYGRIVKADTESIYIDWNILENSTNSHKLKDLECKYCEFWRIELPYVENETYPSDVDMQSRFSTDCKKVENRTFIENEEFIQVECYNKKKLIYRDYFTFPRIGKGRTRKNGEVNVLVIGLDAVSRLNLHRLMPKTVEFLKKDVSSFEMLGYNKIGDNTFPNLVAVLTGLSVHQLTNYCWPNSNSVFDHCPLVWKKYKKAGFQTAFAEDSTKIGLFNYLKYGFRKQPTDYYGQIFNLVSEAKMGHDKRLNTHLCIGNRMTAETLLETTKNFAVRLKEKLTMGMFWSTSLSHDYLNLPQYGDEKYLEFLQTLQSHGVFNTSIVIFLSDHGIRWGGIRETYQGYIEERLPFLFITIPEWFENSYPMAVRNLKINRRRLTTPFDLYETLLDLTDLNNIENQIIKTNALLKTNIQRGISLFLPVPETRTCSSAGITENWCTCHTSRVLNVNDTRVTKISEVLIRHINALLRDLKECSELSLYRIHSARIGEVALDTNRDKLSDYMIVLETVPGHAVLEATVRTSVNKSMVIDPVSRLNTYGDQSKCITHYAMKLYCYCIS